MNETDFRALVKRMRAEQKLYFRTRDRNVLEASKAAERAVDAEIANDGPDLFKTEDQPGRTP